MTRCPAPIQSVLLAFLCAAVVDLASFDAAAQSYFVTDLGPLGTTAYGINESGQVVGRHQATAFLWQNGSLTELNTVGGNSLSLAGAFAINDSGLIAGFSKTSPAASTQATLWNGEDILFLPNLPGLAAGEARDVNNSGQTVGTSQSATGSGQRAVLWQSGIATDLGVLPGNTLSLALAVNDLGQIVGVSRDIFPANMRGFIWDSGVMTNLGTLNGTDTQAWNLNNLGQVVGQSGNDAFLWQNGIMTALPNLSGNTISAAFAINENSSIVGYTYSDANSFHAALWNEGTVHDLNSLIPASSGWLLHQAIDINEQGQIVGWGTLEGVGDRAFLLTVVPEPSTAALLLVALAGTVFAIRKRRVKG